MLFTKISTSIFFLFSIAACGGKKEDLGKTNVKIPKPVPNIFLAATNISLSQHQDTVFNLGKYFSGYLVETYPSGDTAAITPFLNGLQEGVAKKWYPNKQLTEERLYVDGKKEGTHKGWWQNGQPKFLFEVSNDENIGIYKEWYANGQIAKDCNYMNGHEEGSEKMWWDNGSLRANYVIRNGKKYGLLGIKFCVNNYDSIISK